LRRVPANFSACSRQIATCFNSCTSIPAIGTPVLDQSCSMPLKWGSRVRTASRGWKCGASTRGRSSSTLAADGRKCGDIQVQNADARSKMSRCRSLFYSIGTMVRHWHIAKCRSSFVGRVGGRRVRARRGPVAVPGILPDATADDAFGSNPPCELAGA